LPRIITGASIKPGDALIGFGSSGIHSNGYSLARKVLLVDDKLPADESSLGLDRPLVDVLLEPTRIYVKDVLALNEQLAYGIKGMAHITGSGIPGNLPRCMPDGTRAVLRESEWKRPVVFEVIQRINKAGKHLLVLINDVLDISRIEAGKMDLEMQVFDVRPLIDEICDTVQPLAAQNSNTLQIDMADDLGLMRADLVRLKQCLLNLLSNACKFTNSGRVTFIIHKERSERGDSIAVSTRAMKRASTTPPVRRAVHSWSP
jgi:signal transduction histidine kinase